MCFDADQSNLLVMRQGLDHCAQPDSLFLNLTQLRFHQIKDKEIVQVMRSACHLHMIIYSVSADQFCVFGAVTDLVDVVILSRNSIWVVGPGPAFTQDVCRCVAEERMRKTTSSTTTVLSAKGSEWFSRF